MKEKNLRVAREAVEVVDGKVVISSEELVAAIQNAEVDFNSEEETDGVFDIDFGCNKHC